MRRVAGCHWGVDCIGVAVIGLTAYKDSLLLVMKPTW